MIPFWTTRQPSKRRFIRCSRLSRRCASSKLRVWGYPRGGLRAPLVFYNLFVDDFGREKGVDVDLATDLLELKDIYDVAVIVSGDQDYVPAVRKVKDKGKHVVNVSFLKRDGKVYLVVPDGWGKLPTKPST
jgi:NYN domain-containing protein